MELTSKNVSEVFSDCLFKDGEDTTFAVKAEGIINDFGFNPERLVSHKEEIKSMLLQLPKEFKQSSGGGMSFLQACMDEKGYQWGEHRDMEQLFALGIAAELCICLMPRELWIALPGGMPYYVVKDL
jgi:hypothetical protein